MKKSRVKPHQIDEQVFDSKVSRRDLIQGTLLSTVAASALVEAAEPSAHQGGDPKAEVEEIERKLMWLYSNDLPKHVNEIMEYFDDTPEMLQFDVMSPREFKGAAFRKHFNDLVTMFSANIKVDISDMQTHADNHLAFVSSLQRTYGTDPKAKPFEFTIRATDCFRKVNGKWKIVHQHVSFPIDSMESGKADFQSKL
jgi:ketosteroid isomerase-like protein